MNERENAPTEKEPIESSEAFAERAAAESQALEAQILESGMSVEEADQKRALLEEKHKTEKEWNAIIPLEGFESIKNMRDYSPTAFSPKETNASQPPEEITPAVPDAETAPSQDVSETLVNRINQINYVDLERQRALRDLEGKRKGNEMMPGVTERADLLEERLKQLGTDERILNAEELNEKRNIERELKGLLRTEAEATSYLNKADLEIGGNIEIVANNFSKLAPELQEAIRTGNEEVLRKNNISMWAAERIFNELNARERKMKQLQEKRSEGKTTWKDIARAAGTPELAVFSGDEIRAALKERGIADQDIGAGLTQLTEQLNAENAPTKGFSSEVEAGIEKVFSLDLPNMSWEELDELMFDKDGDVRAQSRDEWERREQNALRYSEEVGTRSQLETALSDIKNGEGHKIPAKWLKEFQDVPAVAKFLKQRPPAPSDWQDVTEPKTKYLDSLKRNAARSQRELDLLNDTNENLPVSQGAQVREPLDIDLGALEPIENASPVTLEIPTVSPVIEPTTAPEAIPEITERNAAVLKKWKEMASVKEKPEVTEKPRNFFEEQAKNTPELLEWNQKLEEVLPKKEEVTPQGEQKPEAGMPDQKEELPGAWDPEVELGKILKAPKAERREMLKAYREQLAQQKIGIGNAQGELIKRIRENPALSKEEFMEQFRELTKDLHPTKEQFAAAENAFAAYETKHRAVEENTQKYNTPEALFVACFGQKPQGEIEIVRGPMTLCFRCRDVKDYALLYKGRSRDGQQISDQDIKEAMRSGGCAGIFSLIPELQGSLIAERIDGGIVDGIYQHEEQHALNRILMPQEAASYDENFALRKEAMLSAREELELMNSDGDKDKEKARMMFEREIERVSQYDKRLLRAARTDVADTRAADEILAYMRGGTDPDKIYAKLTKKKEDGGLYDYLNDTNLDVNFANFDISIYEVSKGLPQLSGLLKRNFAKSKEEVFGSEYQSALRNGLDAYTGLRAHGLEEETIRHIFQNEPLSKWPKAAERLREDTLTKEVREQYQKKFGLDEEALQKISGFKELSPGQQLLALKNLESMAVVDVKKDAAAEQKKEWAEKSTWKRAGLSMLTFGMAPNKRIAELEKGLAAKHRNGDPRILAKTLANLEGLTQVAAEGPEVEVKENGELSIKYISTKDVFGTLDAPYLTSENLSSIERFNQAADKLAKYPHEWGYDTARPAFFERFKEERREYNKVKAEYDVAREQMLAAYEAKFREDGEKDPTKRAMLAMNQVDERMQLNQLFNSYPDTENALLGIENQSVMAAAAKDFWKKKGVFVAYGALARAATVAISGGIMLPAIGLIGGGVGAAIGHAEGKRLMKEKRADGRMSEEDAREEIEYAVYKKDKTGKAILDEAGNKIVEKTEIRKIREFTDANFFVKRIDRLSNKLDVTTDEGERALLEKKIAQTVALMKEKNKRGMINFGGSSLESGDELKGNTIANRLNFIQAMSRGEIETSVDHKALMEEMERITDLRQTKIEEKRKEEITRMAVNSGLVRGTFALAGATLTEVAKEYLQGSFDSALSGRAVSPEAAPQGDPSGSSDALAIIREGERGPAPEADSSSDALEIIREGEHSPTSPSGLETSADGESATLEYKVQAGENLTKIIKEHIAIMKDLTPAQQENAIQNLIRKLSPEDMKAIGITDPNRITPGQIIHVEKINDLLGSAKLMNMKGESLINHAQHLGKNVGGGRIPTGIAPEHPDFKGPQGELKVYENFTPKDEVRLVSEVPIAQSAANNPSAFSAGGEHPDFKGPEGELKVYKDFTPKDEVRLVSETPIPRKPAPVEYSPLSRPSTLPESSAPKFTVENVRSVVETKELIHRSVSEDESFVLNNLFELERNTKMNPGLSADIAAAKKDMINMMWGAKRSIRSLAMYKILEAHHLEKKVIVSPDTEGELLMYMETRQRR